VPYTYGISPWNDPKTDGSVPDGAEGFYMPGLHILMNINISILEVPPVLLSLAVVKLDGIDEQQEREGDAEAAVSAAAAVLVKDIDSPPPFFFRRWRRLWDVDRLVPSTTGLHYRYIHCTSLIPSPTSAEKTLLNTHHQLMLLVGFYQLSSSRYTPRRAG
jgi:hypothetical protein